MSHQPRKAPVGIREQIREALLDPARRLLDLNGSSYGHLSRWELPEEGLYTDLAEGLAQDRLFLKPKSKAADPQRYQCLLDYPECDELPAVLVHVTLSPKGEPPRVKVAVHPSDTTKTLPSISIPHTNEKSQPEDS